MEGDLKNMADITEQPMKEEAFDLLGRILSEVAQTPEFKRARGELIHKALSSWAGEALLDESDVARIRQRVDPEREEAASAPATHIDELALWGNLGKLITLGARYLAEKDRADPARLARGVAKPLKDILMNTDFGHLFEMVAASENRELATDEAIRQIMGAFPTKSGILPAIRFKKANTSLKKRLLALQNMQNLTPEVLLSSMVNLFNELIEPEAIGAFVQAVAEGIRKIHVGSVILGESDKSMVELTLANKLRAALAQVDPTVFGKALVALMEEMEGVTSAIVTATAEQPELLRKIVTSYGVRKSPKIRRTRKKAELLEELFDTADGATLIEEALGGLNLQEVGDTVNAWLRILNQLHDKQPEAALQPVASLFSMIDWDELHTAAQWLVPDVIESVKPLAGAIMPSLVHGACDMLTPPPGEDGGELEEALARLQCILFPNGGARK